MSNLHICENCAGKLSVASAFMLQEIKI